MRAAQADRDVPPAMESGERGDAAGWRPGAVVQEVLRRHSNSVGERGRLRHFKARANLGRWD